MIPRERYLNTLQFKPVDRIPLVEWPIRGSTMDAWVAQGYPLGTPAEQFLSLDSMGQSIPVNLGMRPPFREKVLEQDGAYKVYRDSLGTVRKDFLKTEHEGFVTRSWISFAVSNRRDFNKIKKRYNSADPHRIPPNYEQRCKVLNLGPVHTQLSVPFLFWTARDWVGFENLCMMFYDDPGLVHAMFEFITDYSIEVLENHISGVQVDVVELKEDMAYKHAPMISPEMFREFMLPHYIRFIRFLRGHGVRIVFVDCDGYPGKLIPEWIEAGVDAVSPVEIAAGNDLLRLRQAYPGFALFGGIDKRALAKTPSDIYNELVPKVPRMLEKGGYIPHVDHAVPFNVSLENFIYYRTLLRQIADGKALQMPGN